MGSLMLLFLALFTFSVIHHCDSLPTQEKDAEIEAGLTRLLQRLKKTNKRSRPAAGHPPFTSDKVSVIAKQAPECGNLAMSGSAYIIQSAGYDQNTYWNNLYCWWTINAPYGQVFSITFDELNLESHDTCDWDSVSLYDGNSASSRLLGKFCTGRPSPLRTTGSSVYVVLQTDGSINEGRFLLRMTPVSPGVDPYQPQPTAPPVPPINPYNTPAPPAPPSGQTCGSPAFQPSMTRIVGGVQATPHSWPWQCYVKVNLPNNRYSYCGGSVIGDRWILTAAHCFYDTDTNTRYSDTAITVKCGLHRREDPESTVQSFTGIRSVVHEYYSPSGHDWDIAVIQLPTSLTFNNYVQPVCLPSTPVASNTYCYGTGWGDTQGTGDDNVLNQVGLSTFSQYQNPYGSQLTNNMLCAGYLPGGKSICFGDSGGPLVCRTGDRWFQYGISSFVVYSDENNPQCALPNYPPVFANVVTLLSWIQAKTGIGASSRVADELPSDGKVQQSKTTTVRPIPFPVKKELYAAEKELLDLLRRKQSDN